MASRYLSSSFSLVLFIWVWVELVTATFFDGDGNSNEPRVPVEGVPVHLQNHHHQLSHSFPEQDYLSFSYYQQSCPQAESIIYNKVKEWIDKDYTLAPSLIRLHFHDCSVRGCDASILLNNKGGERQAAASKTLRGFEVIDDIKAELEKQCPRTVSCADILTAAARDATVLAGGPFWQVPYGRKDGLVSVGKEANSVPHGQESITELLEFFQSKGLNVLDLAVLSGVHTIGRCTCGAVQDRLYNYNGTHKADPSINPRYLNYLKRKCRWASEFVDLDATTPQKFDSVYFTNLEHGMGLLSTDQLLNSDSRTSPLISVLASQPEIFMQQFVTSMVKLGNVQALTGSDEGEVRTNCGCVNSN
ncbi:hem peroxidase [Dillenia turbinata]|uniref:Peroxidase n=1 Tax=Dillenia turbinata TaxID=194707 RepID=A0AAN8UST6_9MAGN